MKRILVYTHNAIGLGHAVRTLAVITGMRKWRPDVDFLVLSGTSVPHIFLREGIEVIKLPGIKLAMDGPHGVLSPRYLANFDLEKVFDYRQRTILEAFDFFDPDVLMVEHNMAGLMSEVIPVLLKKWLRKGGGKEFALVHFSRGIMRWAPHLQIPYQNPGHKSESINVGHLFDLLYVLEDKSKVDVNKEFLGDDPVLAERLSYMGPISAKVSSELPRREEALSRFGLVGRKIILLTLGRHGSVEPLMRHFLESFERTGLKKDYQIVAVMDPYLDQETVQRLRSDPLTDHVLLLPFIPNLVDLINSADLVICRAGYNTINEILMTDAKALVIPEKHPSGEQERRAADIPRHNLSVIGEEAVLAGPPDNLIAELFNRPLTPLHLEFDKYAIGQQIWADLDRWFAGRIHSPASERASAWNTD